MNKEIIEEEEVKYDFEYLEESNFDNELQSHYEVLYEHLLKYKFVPNKQTKSWINSINEQIDQINLIQEKHKGSWTRFFKDKVAQEKSYKNGLKLASFKSDKSIQFPVNLELAGPEFYVENICNRNYVKNFLIKYFNKNSLDHEYVKEAILTKF